MLISDIITIITCILLVLTLILPKKIRYFVYATVMVFLGAVPLFGFDIGFDFNSPLITYVTTFVVVLSARSLFVEAWHIESKVSWVMYLLGILIIILTTVPTLNSLGALTFGMPKYPEIINFALYFMSGVSLLVGLIFMRE